MKKLTPKTSEFSDGQKLFVFPNGSFEISESQTLPEGSVLGADIPSEDGSYTLLSSFGAFLVKVSGGEVVEVSFVPYRTMNGSFANRMFYYDGEIITEPSQTDLVYDGIPDSSNNLDTMVDRGTFLVVQVDKNLYAVNKSGALLWSGNNPSQVNSYFLDDYILQIDSTVGGETTLRILNYTTGATVDTETLQDTTTLRAGILIAPNLFWLTATQELDELGILIDVSGGEISTTSIPQFVDGGPENFTSQVALSEDAVFAALGDWDGTISKYDKDFNLLWETSEIVSGLILFIKYIPSTGNIVANLWYGETDAEDYSLESNPTLLEISGTTGEILRVWRDTVPDVDDSYATMAGVFGDTLVYLDDWSDGNTQVVWFDLVNWIQIARETLPVGFYGSVTYFQPIVSDEAMIFSSHWDNGQLIVIDEDSVVRFGDEDFLLNGDANLVPAEEGIYVTGVVDETFGIYLIT